MVLISVSWGKGSRSTEIKVKGFHCLGSQIEIMGSRWFCFLFQVFSIILKLMFSENSSECA